MSRPLITVRALLAQQREQGEIVLPENALITPAAADWLHECRTPIRRVGARPEKVESGPTIYVVGDAKNPAIKTLLPGLQREHDDVQFLPCNGHMTGLLDAVRTMCNGLAECSQRRGVAILEDGAIVNCVANRCESVRAAIVSRPSALFDLMRRLGVNLLILESSRLSLRQIQGIINDFLGGKIAVEPAIAAALAGVVPETSRGLTTCGSGASE